MKQMTTKLVLKALTIVICFFVISCKHSDEHKYHTVVDKIEAETVTPENLTVTSETFNENIKTVKFDEDGFEFLIPERKSQIQSYACAECHTDDLDKIKGKDVQKGHWNITLKHANENTMNCLTCHNGDDMDNLKSLTGTKIDFNNSYNLCSQCHTKQFEDWKGGAHGKRIASWAPPRASMTCVNCHNPHSPGFAKRWPAKYNTQKVHERK